MLRVVTVSVLGRESRSSYDVRRLELIASTVRHICKRKSWRPFEFVLLPGGAFRAPAGLGALPEPYRLEQLDDSEAGSVCTALATRLNFASPGCLIVAGFDTPRRGTWRGDLMVATFSADGPVGVTRMIYPVRGDRNLVYPEDADVAGRAVRLVSGRKVWVCVCYDAFALAELASGELGRRGNIQYVAGANGRARSARPGEAVELLQRLDKQLRRAKPDLAVVAIHGFERPGRELLWQRHGLATASAALGGKLVVGASHFTAALPRAVEDSPLAAFGVARDHLTKGGHRPACEHAPLDGFYVPCPSTGRPATLVRLYQAV